MADDNYFAGPSTPAVDPSLGTAGDFAKTLGKGALDIGGDLAATSRYFFEQGGGENGAQISSDIQKIFNLGSDAVGESINPETRKLAASTLTSKEFWDHPVLAAALKSTGMVPMMAAAAIPGGLFADAIGATVAAAGANAEFNAGAGLNEFYKKLDGMSDKDLQDQSPKYKVLRQVFDEKTARAKFNTEAQGWAPAINAVIGAAVGAVGPAGTAARGLAGVAENAVAGAGERGALASAGIGGAEGALGNAAQSGVSDQQSQQTDINAGMQKEFDLARTANAAIEGGALGGIMGGAVGLVAGGGAKTPEPSPVKSRKPIPDTVTRDVSTVSSPDVGTGTPDGGTVSPQPQTGRATAAPAKPPEKDTSIGNPQSAPVGSSRDGAKGKSKTSAPKENPADAPATIDPAIGAAIAANDKENVPVTATEHAAITQASPNETIDKLNAGEKSTAPSTGSPQGDAQASPQAPLDTGQNVPEQPQSLDEQIKQIGTGNRKAVMLPNGSVVPSQALGGRTDLKKTRTSRGRFIYDPKLTTAGEIQKLSSLGRENELLGLGPVSKPDAVARVAAGEKPAAIVESTPTGTEVKAAAGTDVTAPAQAAVLEANKTPGNTVSITTPEDVVAKRMVTPGDVPPKRAPKILPNLTTTADTVPLSDFNQNKVEPPKEPKGKNYSAKDAAARDEKIAKAKNITDAHPPGEHENEYMRDPEARDAVIRRAQAMVQEAKDAGLTIQGQLKKSTKGDALSDHPSIQILRAAKDLAKVAEKRKAGREITEAAGKFAEAERLIRGGHSEEVLAQRREEGDAAMKRGPKGDELHAAEEVTPESELAKKEGAELVSKEDVSSATPEGKADVEKNQVKTAVASSAKGDVRGVGDGTETTKEGVVRAKASRTAPKATPEQIAAMNERLGLAPKKVEAPKKNNGDALRVERNPTEAQKLAGNYKKGHRRVDGLDFTIENPRGAIRKGVGPDGKPWEVRMPADYGYLRGTEGADGDHVDAYDLRHGDKHFIIDQLNEKGEFDEHKVILRAKDENDAVLAYHHAFSDGKGIDRIGYMHEVSTSELKEWLKNGDTKKPVTHHVFGEDKIYAAPKETGAHTTFRGPNGDVLGKSTRSEYLTHEIERLNLKNVPGVGGILARFIQSRLSKIAGDSDTMVHFVTKETMGKLHPTEHNTAEGLHWIDGDNVSHIAVTNALRDNGIEHGSLAHVLIHEAVHSMTVREINNSPAAHATITRLMRATADWMEHPDNANAVELLYGRETRYAFTNPKEFIAEAFSNKAMQEVMAMIPLNDKVMGSYLGLGGKNMSMWDMFRGFVRRAVKKIMGADAPTGDTVLDAVMKVGEHLETIHNRDYVEPRKKGRPGLEDRPSDMVTGEAFHMVKGAQDAVKRYLERDENNTPERAPAVLALRTLDNVAQIADHYFGENNPVRKIQETVERMRITGQKIFERSEPLVRKLVTLRAANAEQFREFASLLHDSTVANVHPDVSLSDAKNAHLGKNKVVGSAVWSKAQHPELAKRFRMLSPDLQEAWHEVVNHFTKTQNEMSLGIINNQILKLMGIKDAALGDRIHSGNLTDADRNTLGANLDVIEKASELSKIEGPYVPLMRRGDHVVKADIKVERPPNAKEIARNEFEFKTEKEATDYAKSSDLRPTIKKVWVDEKTGELHVTDPTTGAEHRVSAQDLDAVPRYRVELNNRHVEFVQGKRAADARAAELAKDSNLEVHKVVPREYEPSRMQAGELSSALGNLVKKLEKSDAYKQATPTQQATMRASINEAALASHGSTRVSSRALPRRNVAGHSEDIVQNTVDYGASSSRYLAKLQHGAELESGLQEMKAQIDRDHSKTGQYARTAISNEVRKRINGDNGFQQGGKLSPVIKRALSISFIDKLGSPAYSVINAMQPGMVTMPYLSGRHGVGRSFAALAKAYSDIGAFKIIKEGIKETGRRIAGKRAPEDFLTSIMENLSPDERRMIQNHVDVGTIDPSAGMEIGELTRSTSGIGGKLDTVLSYLEGVTREMPRAIEAINRAATAIAAYRLERGRGADHEAALQYSKDAVNNTQFNYSPTNSPPLFNHPLLKIALQFKKYGQGMYQLIGSQIANAIRNQNPGDRRNAVKTLITLAATHTAVAGALGLPTEPFKYLLMGAHAAGLTGMQWGDVEDKIRHEAASVFGNLGGEVLTRGLPRLLNVDLSRAGLDSVTSFGDPRNYDKESDVKSWLFDSLAGPVVSLGGDWVKGVNQIANGDFEKAAENIIPLKAASDSLRAYRQYTEGKKSASGKQTMTPYSPTEAGLRVLGFGTGREAEVGAKASAYYRNSAAAKQERDGLVSGWAGAKPSDKAAAWAAIQKWNKQQPDEVKITPKQLTDKAKRDAKNASTAVQGINPNKRDKRFLDEGSVYNVR